MTTKEVEPRQTKDGVVKVGISDMKVVQAPTLIRTIGLGSCIGVVLYDERKQIAGMLHLMLPDSTNARKTSNVAKFADTGIDALIEALKSIGVDPRLLKAKMAGGAQMFDLPADSHMRIGERNIESVKKILSEYKIPVIAENTGGNKGRTIEFNPTNSKLTIRTVAKQVIVI